MTSEIRTNSLTSRAGLSTVTLTDSGPMFSGITTFVDNSGFNLGTGSSIFTPASNTLTFGTNSNEIVRITSSGDFGIGTNSPDRKLDVSGTGNVYGKFQSTNATGAGIEVKDASEDWLIQADGGSVDGLAFYDLGRTSYRFVMGNAGQFGIGNGGSRYGTSGQVLTSGGASGAVSWTTISGTTINNNANNRLITGSGTANTLEGESSFTYDGNGMVDIEGTGAAGIQIKTPNNTDSGIYFRTGSSNTGAISYLQTDNSMKFRVNSTNKMIIDSSGRVGINKTPALASSKLEVGGADNYPLINVEASGATGGMGIGGAGLQFFYGTSEKVRITSNAELRLGNLGHATSKVGGQNITGQDYDPYFKLYASTSNHWLMQLRSDTTSGNGIFLRSGNSSSNYTLYATGYDENNAHFLVRGDGVVSLGAKYTQGGANPQLSMYGSSGRQFKIMNSGSQTTSMQLQNSTTGYGEDAGIQIALLGGGVGYVTNQYAGNYAWEIYQKQSGGSQKHIMRVYRDGKIGHQTDTDNLMLSNSQDGSGSNYFLRGSKNSTTPGGGNDVVWIYEDGDLRNANNSYGQQSDIKLKENVVDANSQWDDIKKLKVRNFNFKASTGFDTHTQIGLIAQEAELVSPGLVKEVKDRVKTEVISEVDGSKSYNESLSETEKTKHVMYSVLYMKAIKALQEAMTRIETLEQDNITLRARVTNLEGE